MIDQDNNQHEHPPYYDEKAEEKLEKEDEKHEEKHHDDPLSSFSWALILIWAGLVFLASNFGWLDQFQFEQPLPEPLHIVGLSRWPLIFLGAGVIIFAEALIRTFVPAYGTSSGGNFVLAAIFLGIGLSGIFSWQLVWPIILIGLGISALASGLIRNRK